MAVLFSPGLTSVRHHYGFLAQHFASFGYVVVTMDHTFEALVLEFTHGEHIRGRISSHIEDNGPQTLGHLLELRVADAVFVLDQLRDLEVVWRFMPEATVPFRTDNTAIEGHSLGGATAVSALMRDVRFKCAVNLDGSTYGILSKTSKPVLLFGRGNPDRHD